MWSWVRMAVLGRDTVASELLRIIDLFFFRRESLIFSCNIAEFGT